VLAEDSSEGWKLTPPVRSREVEDFGEWLWASNIRNCHLQLF